MLEFEVSSLLAERHQAGSLLRIERVVSRVAADVRRLTKQGENMSQELDDLKAEVTVVRTVEESAITLISGIAARIQAAIDAGGTAADFIAMKADLDASSNALAAAVAANTPGV